MNLSRIGPSGETGDRVELLEEAADDSVSLSRGAQVIKLRHDPRQCPLHLADHALRIELALRIEATLTLDEFLAIEIGQRIECRIWLRTRIGEET